MDVKKEVDLSQLKILRQRILKLENCLSQGNSISKEKERAYSEELDSILKRFSFNPCQRMSSMSKNTDKEIIDHLFEPQDKYRYLCVSDGFTICCLDLKKSTYDCNDGAPCLQKVPSKISTLRVLQGRLPFSLGLFNFGPYAYMLGGHEFLGIEDSDLLDLMNHSSDFDFYRFLLEKCIDKSSASCSKPYVLTLNQGSLCLSECSNIGSTNNPTFWPLVERLDNHLHVIESLPSLCRDEIMHPGDYDHITSHEVLELSEPRDCILIARSVGGLPYFAGQISRWDNLSPLEISGIGSRIYINKYLVVGHRIYAIERYFGHRFVVFDSEANEWKSHVHPCESKPSMLQIKHVIEILKFGFGRSIGKLEFNGLSLYVVLAIGTESFMVGRVAVAYLVTTTGQVLCYQRVNHLFMGFKKPFDTRTEGTIISYEQGNEICVVVRGFRVVDSLFITTFTWEVADEALALVSDLCGQIRDENDNLDKLPFIDEEVFMNVTVKGWYVSQLGTGLEPVSGMKPILPRLSACFL